MTVTVSDEDIRNLIRLFDQSDWQEMRVEIAGLKLAVSKNGTTTGFAGTAAVSLVAIPPPVAVPAPVVMAGGTTITAPNLGTFWRRPKPGAPPYVEIGQMVEPDTTVCLIEVMKLFTQVKAGIRGRIAELVAQDGDMVEFGSVLLVVDPV